jgi:serine/threonine protein kinase
MKYYEDGDLYNYLIKTKNKLTENNIINYFLQLSYGIKHLHDNKLIHR